MNNNVTPYKLTLYISVGVALLSVALHLIHSYFSNDQYDWIFLSLLFGILFLVTYSMTRYFLERYIYNRIKPIYKIIRKGTVNKEKISGEAFSTDVIKSLNSEVSKWRDETTKEIDSLKSLEEYRKSYVGNISHELKTPLFSIQGYIHTLLEGVEDTKIQRKFLLRAAANTDRLLNIVKDLEVITRIEEGSVFLEKENFSIVKMTKEIFQDLDLKAKEQNISLKLGEGSSQNFFVHADRESVQRIMSNLITNSIKYCKVDGSTVVSFYSMDKDVLIEIADNGIGIEEKHLKHIFDRFYRTDQSRNRNIGGSGLGLSIVKHLIEAHKKTITVKSELEKGTTFGFTLDKAKK